MQFFGVSSGFESNFSQEADSSNNLTYTVFPLSSVNSSSVSAASSSVTSPQNGPRQLPLARGIVQQTCNSSPALFTRRRISHFVDVTDAAGGIVATGCGGGGGGGGGGAGGVVRTSFSVFGDTSRQEFRDDVLSLLM